MKILTIPDIHLKPYIFTQAAAIMRDERIKPDQAVCMMDIPDDWDKEYHTHLYGATYNATLGFQNAFPNTLWCYGNHDLSYVWGCLEGGFSPLAQVIVQEMLHTLEMALPDQSQIAFIHRIDHVLFMHGGLTNRFVHEAFSSYENVNIDEIIKEINCLGRVWHWSDDSPIWYRPYYYGSGKSVMFRADEYLQVVGHTPCELHRENNVITCDTFSTDQNGNVPWKKEFLLLDTKTWNWKGIVYDDETGCTVIEHRM